MKLSKQLFFLIFMSTTFFNVVAQNVSINVVTQSAGIVKIGELIFFEVVVSNTSSIKIVPSYKLRPQISFPFTLVSVQNDGHVLPSGWAITSNAKGKVTLTNGTDNIGQNERRSILISIKGKALGGPSTIMGNLLYSNGILPGIVPGVSLSDDFLGDNTSSSTVQIVQ